MTRIGSLLITGYNFISDVCCALYLVVRIGLSFLFNRGMINLDDPPTKVLFILGINNVPDEEYPKLSFDAAILFFRRGQFGQSWTWAKYGLYFQFKGKDGPGTTVS